MKDLATITKADVEKLIDRNILSGWHDARIQNPCPYSNRTDMYTVSFDTSEEQFEAYNVIFVEESEADIVKNTISGSPKPSGNDIANALIVIQNDLFNSENALELGQKHKSYSDILNQFLLKGIENVIKQTEINSNAKT